MSSTEAQDLKREIARLKDVKRRALQINDQLAKELVKLRLENHAMAQQAYIAVNAALAGDTDKAEEFKRACLAIVGAQGGTPT